MTSSNAKAGVSPPPDLRMALRVAAWTCGGIMCMLAVLSASDTYCGPVRHAIDAFRNALVRRRLAGQGHCWLCGMSHAFRALWHGHVRAALACNPHSLALFSLMLAGCAPSLLVAARETGRAMKRARSVAAHSTT